MSGTARSDWRQHPRGRAGAIVAATWLIGLGVVLLIPDLVGWTWGEAWPLFLILVAVGSLASRLAWGRLGRLGPWDLTWPLVFGAVGVLLLLSTTGALDLPPGELVARGWPILLLAIGAWLLIGAFWPRRTGPTEHLAIPLEGAAGARIRLRFGAGTLNAGRAAAGNLADGDFVGGVVARRQGPGAVELSPDVDGGWGWVDRPFEWRMGLTGDVPLDLVVESGAARTDLDLSDLVVRSLRLQTGASETLVRLPRAAGSTEVRAEAGAAQVTFEVPAGVAVRVRSRMALGSTQVDEGRFPRTADGYASPDWATAANRVELDLQGGVGSFRVVGGP